MFPGAYAGDAHRAFHPNGTGVGMPELSKMRMWNCTKSLVPSKEQHFFSLQNMLETGRRSEGGQTDVARDREELFCQKAHEYER